MDHSRSAFEKLLHDPVMIRLFQLSFKNNFITEFINNGIRISHDNRGVSNDNQLGVFLYKIMDLFALTGKEQLLTRPICKDHFRESDEGRLIKKPHRVTARGETARQTNE